MDKKKKGKYLNLKVENEHEIVCFVYRTAERRPILTFTWEQCLENYAVTCITQLQFGIFQMIHVWQYVQEPIYLENKIGN